MVDRYQPRRQDDMRESEDGEYVNWQDWLIEHGSRVTAQHRASELESKLKAADESWHEQEDELLSLRSRLGAVASLCDRAASYHGAVTFADAIRAILVEKLEIK